MHSMLFKRVCTFPFIPSSARNPDAAVLIFGFAWCAFRLPLKAGTRIFENGRYIASVFICIEA